MGRAEDHEHEAKGHNDLADEASRYRISARRMIAVAVAGKACMNVETGLSAGDCVKDGSAGNGAQHLGNNIRRQLAGLEAPAGPKPKRDSWIQMATGDMANSEGHGQHSETERQRYADKSDAKLWKGGGKDSRSASAEDQPRSSNEFCSHLPKHCIPLWECRLNTGGEKGWDVLRVAVQAGTEEAVRKLGPGSGAGDFG